jgi:hypothetical protein
MVKIYSIALALGVTGLLVVILGGVLAENLGRDDRDPGRTMGEAGRSAIGGLVGFGMAGMSAEFSTLDLSSQMSVLVAVLGAAAGVIWARYSSRTESNSDAGPV